MPRPAVARSSTPAPNRILSSAETQSNSIPKADPSSAARAIPRPSQEKTSSDASDVHATVPVTTAEERPATPQPDAAAQAASEATVADPEGTIQIESLGQGTLEPLTVDSPSKEPPVAGSKTAEGGEAAADAAGAPRDPSPGKAEGEKTKVAGVPAPVRRKAELAVHVGAPRKRVQVAATPPSNRRLAVLWSIGAVGVVGLALLALRPTSTPKVSIDGVARTNQPAAPVNPPSEPVHNALSADNPANNEAMTAPPAEPPSEDTVRVGVLIRPEGARVFYRGKEIGRTPFTLELLRGERRVFEVRYPGYVSRRLVIDGSEKEIAYALTPDAK